MKSDGTPDERYMGRGDGLRLVRRPLMPPRTAARHGRADGLLHDLAWALNRMEELAHLAARGRGGNGDGKAQAEARCMQWERIVHAMSKRGGCVEKLVEGGGGGGWEAMAEFARKLQGCPMTGLGEIREWASELRRALDDRKHAVAAEGRLAWKAWVRDQLRRGGGALHAFTKREVERAEVAAVDSGGGRCGSPQTHVEADRAEWDMTWQRLSGIAKAPWREEAGRGEEGACLPPPSVQELRRAARKFRPYTGVGADHLRPHWFGWLSDQLLQVISLFMTGIEEAWRWPGQVLVVLVHLIPKDGGGRRPIGLLASVVRWWERVRAPVVQQWRLQHARPYNWAGPGKCAERAVWEQSLLDEAALARGWSSASTLVDLVKAFEHIPLEVLWRKAKAHRFPLRLICLILEICAAPRRLVFRGAVSEATSTLTAVVAGLVAAIDCMFLMVVDALDGLRRDFPCLRLVAYVDDLTLHRTGGEEEVWSDIHDATARLVKELEEGCSLIVSRVKSAVVVSGAGLERRVRKGMKKMGIPVGLRARLLGIDYRPGSGRGPKREVQGRRWGKAMGRRGRMVKLGKRAGPHVAATGLAPAAKFGASVTGPSVAVVRQLGSVAAETYGRMGGRSIWARLGVRGADHRVGLILKPVQAWMESLWEERLTREDMTDAWRYAQRITGLSRRPHSTANGAARSFIAALSRLGWRSPAVDTVLTREGHLLRVGETDVVTIMRYAEDDLMAKMGVESAVGRDINDVLGERGYYRAIGGEVRGAVNVGRGAVMAHVAGSTEAEERLARIWRGARYQHDDGRVIPWLLPARLLLRRRLRDGSRCTTADSSVAALVEGGWWTAARLAASGLRDSPLCTACGKEIGTVWHRLGGCEVARVEREGKGGCPAWLLKKGKASVWDPLFARGVPALPKVPPPPPGRVVRELVGGSRGDEEVATGDVYTDGAVRGRWRRIMRAGWGVVVLKEGEQRVSWRMHGVCPDVYPSVFRAELTAVLNVLRIAMPPLVIHVDNAEVVRGFRLGREWCLAPDRDGGELWKEVWERMGEVEGVVEVVKVKAHTAVEDVSDGVITERDRFGNLHADAEAVRGARLAESLAPVGVAKGELLKAMRWLGWARRYAAIWRPDAEEGEEEGRRVVREAEVAGEPRGGAGLRHLLWERGVVWKCRRCGRVADTDQKRRDLRSSRCQGSAVGRLLARTCLDPEAVTRACLERKQDMTGKGWRPRKGGGEDEDSSRRGGEEEYEEECGEGWGGEEASDDAVSGSEGGAAANPGSEDRAGDGEEEEGAAAGRAAAAARSSGSASAEKDAAGREARPELTISPAISLGGARRASGRPTPPKEDVGPPAPKSSRTRAPPTSELLLARPAVTVVGSGLAARKDDPWDEDPFGHVEAALALPETRRPAAESGAGAGGPAGALDMVATGLASPLAEGGEERGQTAGGPSAATKRRRVEARRSPASDGRGSKRRSRSRPSAPPPSKRRRAASPPEGGTGEGGVGRPGGNQEGDVSGGVLSSERFDSLSDFPELPESEAEAFIKVHGRCTLGLGADTGEGEVGARRGIKRWHRHWSETEPTAKERCIETPAKSERRHHAKAAMGESGGMLAEDGGGGAARAGAASSTDGAGTERAAPIGAASREGGLGASEAVGAEAIGTAVTTSGATEDDPERLGGPVQGVPAYGRRYTGNIGDPVDAADSRGHALRITGPVIYCEKCGRYATRRIGRALKNACVGFASGAYGARLARLRTGLHPITSVPLV